MTKTSDAEMKCAILSFFKIKVLGLTEAAFLGESYENQIIDILTVFLDL